MQKLTKEQQENVDAICRELGIPVIPSNIPENEQTEEEKNIEQIVNYTK